MSNTEAEPDPLADKRRRVGLAVLGAVIVIIVVILLVSSPWSDGADTDAPTTTEQTTPDTATSAPPATEPTTPDAPTVTPPATEPTTPGAADPGGTPADQIPVATIDVGGPGGPCAAVVARLELYSAAAKASSIPELRLLFEKLSEFEAELFQYAQGEVWGDRLIEQLVVVRRGWVDAASTLRGGDAATAQQLADEANALLDSAIATAPC